MSYLYSQLSYPIIAFISLCFMVPLIYYVIKYYRKWNIWITLFFVFIFTSILINLLIESFEEYQILLNLIPILRILSIISFLLIVIIVTKAGFKNAWQNNIASRKLVVGGGILFLIVFMITAILLYIINS